VELPTLDWSNAKVKDGVLTVEVSGERPKGWDQTFNTTAKLLGGGDWEDVELKKGKVKVTGVSPGVEERLHHFLESVVQQADTTHQPSEDESDPEGEGEGEGDAGEAGEQEGSDDPDAEATSRFRAFGD
jgi:hypothetical protein